MGNVYGQHKEARFIITFELPKNEGYEEALKKIASERQYTNIFGKMEDSFHQIARRILIEVLNEKTNESIARSKEVSISS